MKRVLLPIGTPAYTVDPTSGDVRIRPRAKLLERQIPTAGRVAAFDKVHEDLAVFTEIFQHNGDGGRQGVYRAMAAVLGYFASRGIPPASLRPIEAVMEAIVDADKGVASPIFDPKRGGERGRPPKPFRQVAFEGQLAIIMECCVRHCQAQGQRPYIGPAADLAAKLINASAWPAKPTAKQLIEIRERIQQSASDSPDRMQVNESLSSDTSKALPLAWAKILLSHEWVNPPPKLSA